MDNYYNGFIDTCETYGMEKSAAISLYKEAVSRRTLNSGAQILRGLRDLYRGVKGTTSGIYQGGKDIGRAVGRGLDFINRSGTGKQVVNLHNRFAKSLSSGFLSKVPGLRSFGRGYARSQRQYINDLRRINRGRGRRSIVYPSLTDTLFSTGKGSVIGNTMAGLGSFTQAHPLIGPLAYTVPAVWLANKFLNSGNDNASIDTLTPAQQRMYERSTGAGYSGLDSVDYENFGML